MTQDHCKDGICAVPAWESAESAAQRSDQGCVIYVGDPMCSWCYGIAPVIKGLQEHCDSAGIGFDIVVGGLRTGGIDQWTPSFRDFLRNTWIKIEETTGQRFNLALLDQAYFDYDTTPSCKAVVAAKELLPADNGQSLAAFFEVIQYQFYYEGKDPKLTDFYHDICDKLQIDYAKFKALFESEEIERQTIAEFQWSSSIGINGFPSFLWVDKNGISLIDSGYTSLSRLIRRIPHTK